MKFEVTVYIKRLLSIAKSPPGIVFILCVYTFTSAAVYMNIEDHRRNSNENQCEEDNTLNYWETLFFFVAMITTIGYGHITPHTIPGKVFVMTYSAIGIPLTALIITDFGKRLSTFVTRVCLLMRNRSQERIARKRRSLQKDDKMNILMETETYENTVLKDYEGSIIPLIISMAVLVVYILMGSVIYSSFTNVSYVDAVYMVFSLLSTIGARTTLPSDSTYYIGSVIYILIGLTILSMCVYAALQYNNVKSQSTEHLERKENNANVEQYQN
ncbi:TWiK family of potassium channels protein 7-like [Mytilus trossulus]|uniref:TWiK family of potassium channels protein 7-like n=1 Tax=Mytilus trossulus TaxID=6551 RepID=UPI003004D8E7